MKFNVSSMSIPNVQWDSLSKEIFQKVLFRTTWRTRSHNQPGERTHLLDNGRAMSMNERGPPKGSSGQNGDVLRPNLMPYVSKAWPPSFRSYQLPTAEGHKSVSISEVCRTATPMLPPVQAEKEGVSWAGAAFLIINAALGIGILNFPAAYNQAGGVLSATVIQLLMLVMIILTMLILAYCSDVNSDVTYHDVLMSMCGSKAQKLAALSITCTCYGVGVAVIIIIGDQLDRLFLSIFGPTFCHQWYLERHFTVSAVTICFVLPLCYCKRVDFLRYAGSLGIFAMLYPVFLTVYGYYKLDIEPPVIRNQPESVAELCAVVPVLCLAYQSQEVVVPVYACLKERNLVNFTKSCLLAMGFLLVIYSTIGCYGFLTFGTSVQPNVMKMYDAKDPVVMVGVGALIVKMIVTYPVLALCGRGAVDGLYSELRGLSAADFIDGEKRRRIVIASLWFGSALLVALYTSSIGKVINLLSSVTAINVFVYPGICLMCVILKKDRDLVRWQSRLIVVGSILLVAIGTFFFAIVLFNELLGVTSAAPAVQLCHPKS